MKKSFRTSNSPIKFLGYYFFLFPICQNLEIATVSQQLGRIAVAEHSYSTPKNSLGMRGTRQVVK